MTATRCLLIVALVAWLGGLACVGRALSGAQVQDKGAESSAKERNELEKQAVALFQQGVAHYQKGRLEDAFRALERCLSLERELYPKAKFPDGHLDLATSLNALGFLLNTRGKLAQAERCYREALAMRRKLYSKARFPDGHLQLATSLNNLGLVLVDRGDLAQAEPLLREALAMLRQLYPQARHPEGHPQLATSLNNLGGLLKERGELAQAEPFYRAALAMHRKLYPQARYPDGHPQLATSLNNLAGLLYARGELAQAEPYCCEVLAMCRKLYPQARFPAGHSLLATSLSNLGKVLQERGELAQAAVLLREALAMCQKLYPHAHFPDGHARLAYSLSHLGLLLKDRGELGQAERLLREALAMCRKLYPQARFPDGHFLLASSLSNLSNLLVQGGEITQAEPLLREALAMCRKLYPQARFPDGDPLLASSLNNLGHLLAKRGELAQAEPLLREAVATLRKLYPRPRFPDGHPHLANSLLTLGSLLKERGELAQAEPTYREALAMCRRLYPQALYPKGHHHLANSLNNLGILLDARGQSAQAEHFYREALTMRRKLYPQARFPDGHPRLASSLYSLGRWLEDRGAYGQAEPLLVEALPMYQRLAASFAAATAEAQALNFLARLPQARDSFLRVTANLPNSSAAEVYPVLWRGKAVLARALERRQRLFHALTEGDARRQFQELLDVRRELAHRILRPDNLEKEPPQRLKELSERREQLERTLAAQLPHLKDAPPSYTELRDRLPADTAFVDLFRFRHRPQGEKSVRPHYTAFILRQGATVVRVALGEAEPIEKALAAWRQAIANGLDSKAAAELRQRVWDKLAPHLPTRPGSTVYLCPDADLSALPWAALPGRAKGTILFEDHALALVPHGQALLDQLRPRGKDRAAGALLALGGPRFDKLPDPAKRPDDLAAVRPAQRSNTEGVWPDLPGSAREASAVAALARTLPRPPKVLERSGSAANATQLYLDLPQVRWAHLATHGFFAAPESKERKYLFDEKEFRLGAEGFSGRERLGAGARHPLTQTGLVLAGANRKGKEAPADGGILTAEAIAGLDLSKLELAVLSACETGLGEAATGEGVFGLQRAFHLGGCRNVVASLWKVDDDATAALMALFYHELWVNERPPLEALRRAQLALYRHPGEVRTLARVRGPDFDKTVRRVTQPPRAGERPRRAALVRDWAAFVLSGSGQ